MNSIASVKHDSPHGRNIFGTMAKSTFLIARSCRHFASSAASAACSIGAQGALKTYVPVTSPSSPPASWSRSVVENGPWKSSISFFSGICSIGYFTSNGYSST